jgi:hypothetical protein
MPFCNAHPKCVSSEYTNVGKKKGCLFPGFLRGKSPNFINDINFPKKKSLYFEVNFSFGAFFK